MRKKILFGFALVMVGLLIFFLLQVPKKISIAVMPRSYVEVLSADETASLQVSLYVNQDKSYVTDINKVDSVYLSDYDQSNQFRLICKDIEKISKNTIDEQEYFEYVFVFDFGYVFTDTLVVKEGYLHLHYKNGRSVELYLGSFAHYKTERPLSQELKITGIKGIVNAIEQKKTLVGMALKLSSDKDILIRKVNLLHPLLHVSGVREVKYDDVLSHAEISTILGFSYEWKEQPMDEYSIPLKGEKDLVFSLGYERLEVVEELGFEIIYEADGEVRTFVYQPFQFFIDHERLIYTNELDFYTYEFD